GAASRPSSRPRLRQQVPDVAVAVLAAVLLGLVGLGDVVLGAQHVVVLQPLGSGPDLRHLRCAQKQLITLPLQCDHGASVHGRHSKGIDTAKSSSHYTRMSPLKTYRSKRRMSQAALAAEVEAAGQAMFGEAYTCEQGQISRWERGAHLPAPHHMLALLV